MKIDWYRIFFPAGFVLGLWGASVWILYSFHVIDYPGVIHPEIMMSGFLLMFVTGFLCTAVPKFTDSFPPTKNEFFFSLLLLVGLFFALLKMDVHYFRIGSLFTFLYLSIFLIRRFIHRRADPPVPFLFIGVGVVSGLCGSLILFLSHFDWVSEKVFILGRLFVVQGYILSFILGVGSRLIPSFLGTNNRANNSKIQKELNVKSYALLGGVYLLTYVVEAFVSSFWGMIVRDFIIIFIAFFSWKIYQLPNKKAIHAYGLWISCWFLVLGHVGASLSPEYKIHFMHLFYIGGLSLMTLLVATRVTLSHGGHGLEMEWKSKVLVALVGCCITAALIRFFAGFFPSIYLESLLFAALIWVIGLIVWGGIFIPKILYVKK